MNVRTGKLLRQRMYLLEKHVNGTTADRGHYAPAGTVIESDKHKERFARDYGTVYTGTNEGHEDAYGGTLLYWVDLPDYGHNIGAELGVDFEWDAS